MISRRGLLSPSPRSHRPAPPTSPTGPTRPTHRLQICVKSGDLRFTIYDLRQESAKLTNMDAMDLLEEKDEKQKSDRLNSWVAVAIALLAAFMGICSIKDGNIVQNMQQSQAKSIDTWNYYQAKNIREDIYKATADQLRVQGAQQSAPQASAAFAKKANEYEQLANKEKNDKGDLKTQAEGFDKDYDKYNFHDDQFDLSDATLSLAISLLAVTALTKKRWLFAIAMIPAVFGIIMGLSGLFGWNFHPNALINPLT